MARYFVVDLDHCSAAGFNLDELKELLKEDLRVFGAFVSPGGDGLKILFTLENGISDSAYFSTFYKSFLLDLAAKYPFEQMLDFRTHDVTRACFFSADETALFKPNAIPVKSEEYLGSDNEPADREVDRSIKTFLLQQDPVMKKEVLPLPDETIEAIKSKLKPEGVVRKIQKEVFVPEELQTAVEEVKRILPDYNLVLLLEENIQYGKKLRIGQGKLWAEINVFYGKRGFSIVKTTKSGSNEEMGNVVQQLLEQLIIV